MIAFVERKVPDYARIAGWLRESAEAGTWTNFGPVSLRLEAAAHHMLDLPPDRCVVACANGTAALHGLVLLEEHLAGRRLRWVVSAFTFHAQTQGPLAEAQVLDCDSRGFLSLEDLAALPIDSYDGVIVTHLFGTAAPAAEYAAFASQAGKILLFDSATCFGPSYPGAPFGRFGHGEIFSFHHTKPCGFGEGGAAVLPAEREELFRSLINFGLYKQRATGGRSFNGKMSDVSAAFVLDRWQAGEAIRDGYRAQFDRLARLARELGATTLTEPSPGGTPSLAPVLFPSPVDAARLAGLPIALHKYYRPLASRRGAEDLYNRIVCFPCHSDLAELNDEDLRRTMRALAGASRES